MQRAYDQLYTMFVFKLAVNFCLDRAGFAGSDGPTHHGAYDLAYSGVSRICVAAPMNESELRTSCTQHNRSQ